MRCEHEHDDGAYVLGALSPAERAAYERHLATCSFCREAVADIAVLPGLLGRLDPAGLEQFLPSAAETSRVPALLDAARARRRRNHTRVRVLTTTQTAAVVALIAGIGAIFLLDDGQEHPRQGPTVAMTPIDGSVPISARGTLAVANGGTKVDLSCLYDKYSLSS